LETAQITRTVARTLGLNVDLAEAVALAHDLGHPPFGHAGEKMLNDLMRGHGGFDHNAQSLRTVDWLEVRYPNFRGLNLTYEVREGIIKHSAFKRRPAAQEFDPSLHPCLEAQIVDFADEIAYLAHDVDDGLEAQMLTAKHLQDSRLYNDARLAATSASPSGDEPIVRYQTVNRMINRMVTDLVTNVDRELTAAGISSIEQVHRASGGLAGFGSEVGEGVKELKQVMRDHLYRHYRVSRMTEKAGRVLARLFESYMAEPRQIPEHVLARTEQDPLARVVADYIAGMTDRFALDEYRKLFDPDERV
jgi:dGTPase